MTPARKKMKILIGTPIHISKDYSIEKWLKNVSKLEYPADLFLVDNSPGLDYVEKIKGYCRKYGINPVRNLGQSPISNGVKNYRIEHIEIPQGTRSDKSIDEQIHERIANSREIIRQEVLSSDYEAWFCWESDQIIPTNALDKLAQLMRAGDFMIVDHNCWVNNIPDQVNFDFGVTLIKRECLEKYSFIPKLGVGPDMSPSWYEAESWFRKRIYKDGCNYTEVEGVIEPIYHLDK